MASLDSLTVISQNTTGWSEAKASTLKTIMDSHKASIAAIQEHFQLDKNIYKIQNEFNNHCVFSLPAVKSNASINKGRPSGGISMIYSKNIQRFVTHIIVPKSDRVQALKVSFPHGTYIFINVYFPSDPQRANFNEELLLKTLQDLRYILNSNDTENFVILGDINSDFSRNTRFVNIVRQFMEENQLMTLWEKFDCDFTNIQPLQNARFSFSTIDHFLIKRQCLDNYIDACVLHLGENLSNHEIIYLKMTCPHNSTEDNQQSTEVFKNKPNWSKISINQIEMLRENLIERMSSVYLPDTALCCRDLHCGDEQHLEELDAYTLNLLNSLEQAVDENVPKILNEKHTLHIPGWNEVIKPLREQVNLWKFLWLESGKTLNTQVHLVYRKVRHRYHYTIRHLRKFKQDIKNSNFLKAAADGKFNDILKTLKIQRNGKSMNSNIIDNVTGEKDISTHFSNIYKGIYNHHDEVDLVSLFDSVNEKVNELDKHWLQKITPECIKTLIGKLKIGKNDEFYDFKTEAFKYTSDIIAQSISKLFKSYLIHGHFPNIFLYCTLIPIVKNNSKSKAASDNYRLIAISSVLLKLFDLLFLHLFPFQMQVDTLQFGFQTGGSTDMCNWTLRETINYYINNGSPVYLCLLDLRKAFDHVKLNLLFKKLKSRLPGIFVRLILYTYLVQRCYIKWGNSYSREFTISNGLRQGAVASPSFFNIYINDMFKILRNSRIGCHIGRLYYGCLGYADDISLISPSRQGLQKMINIVSEYCNEHGIEISTDPIIAKSKTKVITFNCIEDVSNLSLYGKDLPTVNKWEHLGHTILNDESATYDITRSRAMFIGDIHSLHQELGTIDPYIFLKLVRIYFCAFYGSSLWDLQSKAATSLYATFNYMIRDTFDLPYGTHRFILKEISGLKPLKVNLEDRFRKFCSNLVKSKRPEVNQLFNIQRHDCRSTFGRNYRNIVLTNSHSDDPYELPNGCEWKINMIKELIEIRMKNLRVEFLQQDEIETQIQNLRVEFLQQYEIETLLQELCCD